MNLLRDRRKKIDDDTDGPQGLRGQFLARSIQISAPFSPQSFISPPIFKPPCQARSYSLHRITGIPEPGQEDFANLRTDFLRVPRANTSPSSKLKIFGNSLNNRGHKLTLAAPTNTKHKYSRDRPSSDPLTSDQRSLGTLLKRIAFYHVEDSNSTSQRDSGGMASPKLLEGDVMLSVVPPSRNRVEDAAKDAQRAVAAKLKQVKVPMPPFDFLEIIGKGSYGLVYKARGLEGDQKIVALKIIDTDGPDYKAHVMGKNDSIDTTLSEIQILKQLCSVNTKNVNKLLDVFQAHSQIWIVTEFCPGGSVRTLMRALPVKRLPDKYMIPIARELAIALESIHAAGIIHRDIKAANIMIHEEGMLKVIDFGVSAVLLSEEDKRKTIIGTPHWMAPEMHKRRAHTDLTYGTEIDVWAYGCTLIECATGAPPFANVPPNHQLAISASRSPPRLNRDEHPEGLADLVASALNPKPAERPSMADLLTEPYVRETEEVYPISALSELVKTFAEWQNAGGERASLFMAGGAQAADYPEDVQDDGDWNFSTTANFRASFFGPRQDANFDIDKRISHSRDSSGESLSNQMTPGLTPPQSRGMEDWSPPQSAYNLSDDAFDAAQNAQILDEASVKRGERALGALFDESKAPYSYPGVIQPQNPPKSASTSRSTLFRNASDLPLRSDTEKSTITSKEIVAGLSSEPSRDSIPNIDLANVNTIKANKMNRFLTSLDSSESEDDYSYLQSAKDKRETLAWSFPKEEEAAPPRQSKKPQKRATAAWTFETAGEREDDSPTTSESNSPDFPVRPALVHSRTAPVGNAFRAESTVMDLDAMYLEGYGSDSDYRSALASDNDEEKDNKRLDSGNEGSQTGTGLSSRDESLLPTPTAPFAEHAAAVRDRLSATSNINYLQYDTDFDPEMEFFDDQEEKDQVTAMLERQDVNDLALPLMRKKILESRRQAREAIRHGPQHDTSKRPLDDYEMEPATSSWDGYSPDASNVPRSATHSYSLSISSRLDDSPPSSTLRTGSSIATSGGFTNITTPSVSGRERREGFPEVLPPSAEALEDGASDEVVEAELGRLLGDWVQGLEFMGGVGVEVEDEGYGED